MPRVRMHADEVETDVDLLRQLVAAQHPVWGDLAIVEVEPWGTDNALFRLGDELVARLPRTGRTEETLRKELAWLPTLAPHLPLDVPAPVADGAPGDGYPFVWAVYSWLEGEPATDAPIRDGGQAAAALAGFVTALQAVDPAGGPSPGSHNAHRGVPLSARDDSVRAAIAALGHEIDTGAVTAAWERALAAPEWAEAPVWVHGDLDARNLLVRDGRIAAVVDFGCLAVGDPACDVAVAWKLFPADTRGAFREALHVDGATWARARGWALSQALIALPYYTEETNATLVREARRWLAETLADA